MAVTMPMAWQLVQTCWTVSRPGPAGSPALTTFGAGVAAPLPAPGEMVARVGSGAAGGAGRSGRAATVGCATAGAGATGPAGSSGVTGVVGAATTGGAAAAGCGAAPGGA